MTRQLALYFFASGTAAAVNLCSRHVYSWFFNFGSSIVVAYLSGMLINFFLSKWFVFDQGNSGDGKGEFIRFSIVASFGLLVTLVISYMMLFLFDKQGTTLSAEQLRFFAHICGVAAGFVANFCGHKLFSFRQLCKQTK